MKKHAITRLALLVALAASAAYAQEQICTEQPDRRVCKTKCETVYLPGAPFGVMKCREECHWVRRDPICTPIREPARREYDDPVSPEDYYYDYFDRDAYVACRDGSDPYNGACDPETGDRS